MSEELRQKLEQEQAEQEKAPELEADPLQLDNEKLIEDMQDTAADTVEAIDAAVHGDSEEFFDKGIGAGLEHVLGRSFCFAATMLPEGAVAQELAKNCGEEQQKERGVDEARQKLEGLDD